jgi:hypothetical protein
MFTVDQPMTATVIPFPPRGPFAVHVERKGADAAIAVRRSILKGSTPMAEITNANTVIADISEQMERAA